MVRLVHIVKDVHVPENVDVVIEGKKVTVTGPKGSLTRDFSYARGVMIKYDPEGRRVIIESYFAKRNLKAVAFSIAAHIKNMIDGVTKGFRYRMKIVFTHFPITVRVDEGNKVVYIENFLGERKPREAKIYGDVKVRLEGRNDIVVEGIDIEKVGQTAANIELATKIKDRDPRIFVDGIYIYKREYMEGGEEI
jgi:large subunit ribosomal protein L6